MEQCIKLPVSGNLQQRSSFYFLSRSGQVGDTDAAQQIENAFVDWRQRPLDRASLCHLAAFLARGEKQRPVDGADNIEPISAAVASAANTLP